MLCHSLKLKSAKHLVVQACQFILFILIFSLLYLFSFITLIHFILIYSYEFTHQWIDHIED